jgi:hypothetical protein
MRSTTPFRLQQCRAVAFGEQERRFWAKPVFGRARPISRDELRAKKEALKRLITEWVDGAPTPPPPAVSGEAN